MAIPEPPPTLRRRNARGDGEKLREQLVSAAVAVLDAEGDAERVSVRAIARAAGVSPTALYLHFADRQALVSAAVDRGFVAFNDVLLTAARAEDTPSERVRAMGLAYLDFATRQPALYAVIFSTRRPMMPAAEPRADREEALRLLAATVAAATAVAPAEATELAMALWASLHGYASLRTARPMHDWPDAERFVARLERAYLGS